MSTAALTNDTTPTLNWADVSGANKYHAQISQDADFSSITIQDNTLATSTFTPGSALTDQKKYYWRWRSSTDGGATWSVWSEKYSFWLDSSWSTTITPTTWMLVNASDITDTYSFDAYPEHSILEDQILRSKRRNLAGDLLTEITTVKATINLIHDGAFMTEAQRNEILRFYHMTQGFYLLAAIDNGVEGVEKSWKCVFSEAPEFNMLAPGREDHYRTTLTIEEV